MQGAWMDELEELRERWLRRPALEAPSALEPRRSTVLSALVSVEALSLECDPATLLEPGCGEMAFPDEAFLSEVHIRERRGR